MVKDLVVRQSLCPSTLPDACQNTRNNTNKHIFPCRSSRPASPRVCGWLVVVYSMCHRNFTRFPTGTWVLKIRQTMRQNCVKPSLRFQSAAKQRVDIRLCHETLRAQHNRTNENDETLTHASKEHVGGCVCGLKNLRMTGEKDVEDQSGSHEKKTQHMLIAHRESNVALPPPCPHATHTPPPCVDRLLSETALASTLQRPQPPPLLRWWLTELLFLDAGLRTKFLCTTVLCDGKEIASTREVKAVSSSVSAACRCPQVSQRALPRIARFRLHPVTDHVFFFQSWMVGVARNPKRHSHAASSWQ